MADITVSCADTDMPRVVAGLCMQAGLTVNDDNAHQALTQIICNAIVQAETAARLAALQAELADPPTIVPPVITVT